MVRFHWHVEQGQSAYMPPDGITLQKESRVQHASCEIEVGDRGASICQVRSALTCTTCCAGTWTEGNASSNTDITPTVFETRQGISQCIVPVMDPDTQCVT